MKLRDKIVPGILLFIGFLNIMIAVIIPSYPLNTLPFLLFFMFFMFAVVAYLSGGKNIIKTDSIPKLMQYVVFDLPPAKNFKKLTLKRGRANKELSGIYKAEGEEAKVQITHIRRENLAVMYSRSSNPGEKLLDDLREEDEDTLEIRNIREYQSLSVNGEIIPAYTAEVETKGGRHPVLRGTANLEDKGIVMISVAANSRKSLEKTVNYLAKMQT